MAEVSYSYKKMNNGKIVIREFRGNVEYDVIVNSFEFLINEMVLCDNCKGILTDFSNANLKIGVKDVPKLSSYLRSGNVLKNIKLAVIGNNPEKVVAPLLMIRKLPFFKIKPFSTKEAALHWMLK